MRGSVGGHSGAGPLNVTAVNQHVPPMPRKGSSRHSRAESKRGPLVLRSDEAYAEYSTGKNGAMAVRKNSRGGKEVEMVDMPEPTTDLNATEL